MPDNSRASSAAEAVLMSTASRGGAKIIKMRKIFIFLSPFLSSHCTIMFLKNVICYPHQSGGLAKTPLLNNILVRSPRLILDVLVNCPIQSFFFNQSTEKS
ncbi:hypothetical protein THIOM_002837 [Candidatus Thiomargarita nelsonii]|uniref:Uncharacterized protein n=1 Tax=Candidatus Thiomargarita nelsonii TaxID=1003181 RepID=A0A176S079_9GAMM|nr:hypothetical protein THIOM_002837 [Candidatus Thiomargarita nelsonii]